MEARPGLPGREQGSHGVHEALPHTVSGLSQPSQHAGLGLSGFQNQSRCPVVWLLPDLVPQDTEARVEVLLGEHRIRSQLGQTRHVAPAPASCVILSHFLHLSEPQFPHLYHILKLDVRLKKGEGRVWEYLKIMVGYASLLQNKTKQSKAKQNKTRQLSFTESLRARHCTLQALSNLILPLPSRPQTTRSALSLAPFPQCWNQSSERLKAAVGAGCRKAWKCTRLPMCIPTLHMPPDGTCGPLKTNSIPSLIFHVTFVILLEKAGINIFIILFNSWIVCETPKKTRMHLWVTESKMVRPVYSTTTYPMPPSDQSSESTEIKTKTTRQLHNDYVNARTFKKSRKFKR